MSNEDYYPAGAAHDPNAPYNQLPDPEPIDVNVVVSNTLSKTTTIQTCDYEEEPWEDWDVGDEGEVIHNGGIEYSFDNCVFPKDYKESEYTILELLGKLKEYVEADINNSFVAHSKEELNKILTSLDGWEEDDLEVIQD